MNPNVFIAVINLGGSFVVSIAALVMVYRGLNAIEARLEVMDRSLKQFARSLSEQERRIQRLEDKGSRLPGTTTGIAQ
jgi:hypothetical protein